MVVEGAAQSIGNGVGRAIEASRGLAKSTTEKVNSAMEGVKGKLRGPTAAFRKGLDAGRSSPQATSNTVDAVANDTIRAVDTGTESASHDAPISSSTEGGADADPKKTVEVDRAKAERAQKEAQFKDNLNKRYKALKEPINEEFTKFEKNENGFPKDEDKRNEYFDKCTKAKNEARTAELKATLVRDFENDNPPPNESENPEEFRKWLNDREAYMNAAEEAKQEAEKVAKAAESGADAEKQKAEGVEGENDGVEKEEDASASMGNAFRLANELEKAENDKAREIIEGKIEKIHNANQKSNPKFKTKVTICKTILMGRAIALMSAMGVASSAVNQVK